MRRIVGAGSTRPRRTNLLTESPKYVLDMFMPSNVVIRSPRILPDLGERLPQGLRLELRPMLLINGNENAADDDGF
jgi:hypothetical protein